MKLRGAISAVIALFITVADIGCGATRDADPALRPQRWQPDQLTALDDTAATVTVPTSFTMNDLTALSHADVAIEPIDGGAADEIVVEDDGKQVSEQDNQVPAEERKIYNVAGAATPPVRPIPPLATPSEDTTTQRTVRVDAYNKNNLGPMPTALRDTGVAQNPVAPARHHGQRPQVQQLPRSTPRPTRLVDEQELPPPSDTQTNLRPAYRMHIRANGQGLEPFLHKLVAAMTVFKGETSTRTPSSASKLEAEPPAQGEEEYASEVRLRPRQQQTSPPFETMDDLAEAITDEEVYPHAWTKTKTVKTQPPEGVTTGFRGKRDEFHYSLGPSPAPAPAPSKLIGVENRDWTPKSD